MANDYVEKIDLDGEQWDLKDSPLSAVVQELVEKVQAIEALNTVETLNVSDNDFSIEGVKRNNVVSLRVTYVSSNPPQGYYAATVNRLPEKWRPSKNLTTCLLNLDTFGPCGALRVQSAGLVQLWIENRERIQSNVNYTAELAYVLNP